ncbi:nickel-dependent lactate racemase [Candidatus Bathyarchaeota archaeon]|nr:MAG: nickel-dependent lactate racemase [Candidatus Bathyarchaeota archaeon]
MVDVWLPYGKTEVCARIPAQNFLGTVEPKEKPGASDPIVEIKSALQRPIGTKRLSEIAKAGDKVAIVVDDFTRRAPSHLMVPPILEELNRAGVKDDDITIIFASGTHRAVTDQEAKMLLGEEVAKRIRYVSHNCDAEDLVYVGKTRTYGTDVYINRIYAEADVKILTGDVSLHYYAGYGGGRKSVVPGVSGRKTIQQNHAMLLHPRARTGILEGNPVHEDMMEAAELAKIDFILNVVTNSKGEIVRAFAGDWKKAFYEGVKLVDEMYKVPVERKADIVLVSCGGHPFDINLYQAYKAVDGALEIVKRGGVIVWVAECSEGYGNQVFFDWMRKYKTLKDIERAIKRKFELGGHKAYYLLRTLERVKIILVSVMPDYYAVDVFKLKTARSVNEALDEAFRIAGKNAKVWAIPYGNITQPILKTSSS